MFVKAWTVTVYSIAKSIIITVVLAGFLGLWAHVLFAELCDRPFEGVEYIDDLVFGVTTWATALACVLVFSLSKRWKHKTSVAILGSVACLLVAYLGLDNYTARRLNDINCERLKHWRTITVVDIREGRKGQESSGAEALIGEEATKQIVRDVTFNRGTPSWKESYLGRVKLDDGTQMYLTLSYQGGFFTSHDTGYGYYQTHGESRKQYDLSMEHVVQAVFVPQR